ncbi:MAG: endonuclease/exonuclease/phosphatase family protein [Ferruginibacter sp.]
MKIITWNCNMAFRNKAGLILSHKPDILVVPECEHPGKLSFKDDIPKPTGMLWFGSNTNKGLGIFSYGKFKLRLKRTHNASLKMIIPIAVTGSGYDFTLYAVWANNPNDPDGQYVEQVWKAVHHYARHLKNKSTILIGDFNSNTIWDRKSREGNHSNVVKRLEENGIVSCYHLQHKQTQGKEQHPTFYLYKHKDKPYHLDYCFVSRDLSARIQSVEIGEYEVWKKYSDHVPVMVTLRDPE